MNVVDEVDALLVDLGDLDEHCSVLAAVAQQLAVEVMYPADGKSVAGAARELRATVAELVERTHGGADDGAGWDFGAGPAPLRDVSQPVAPDVRPRGRRGGKAAG